MATSNCYTCAFCNTNSCPQFGLNGDGECINTAMVMTHPATNQETIISVPAGTRCYVVMVSDHEVNMPIDAQGVKAIKAHGTLVANECYAGIEEMKALLDCLNSTIAQANFSPADNDVMEQVSERANQARESLEAINATHIPQLQFLLRESEE